MSAPRRSTWPLGSACSATRTRSSCSGACTWAQCGCSAGACTPGPARQSSSSARPATETSATPCQSPGNAPAPPDALEPPAAPQPPAADPPPVPPAPAMGAPRWPSQTPAQWRSSRRHGLGWPASGAARCACTPCWAGTTCACCCCATGGQGAFMIAATRCAGTGSCSLAWKAARIASPCSTSACRRPRSAASCASACSTRR
ncbi:MAG: hypothetical protein JM57_09590 [Comamonadaceae bacterium BICA1-1]|nr:MAG: hypothetical protein JM57_09590 [Comamonadaceae bacterium BICA1-1]